MQGWPNLSNLPKATQSGCGVACVSPYLFFHSLSKITPGQAGRTVFTPLSCCLFRKGNGYMLTRRNKPKKG